ncbi:hypothetical protein Tco_0601457 [Tanacetum coccineum]
MSSPNHFTSNIEDAFSSMNILNYTSVSSDYFPASSGSSSFNSSKDSRDESPIPPPDPITPPVILTPSAVLSPSLLFDPRYFFVPEELLPPKKQIYSPSSFSTTLSNSSQKQAYSLESPSFSVYTPTPPQIFEIGKSSMREHLKHHEKQIEDILYYLEELSFHLIEKMEERLVNGWIIIPRDFDEVKTKLKEARTQILELQKKHMGQRDKIAFVRFRISDLEMTLEDIQDRHQTAFFGPMDHLSLMSTIISMTGKPSPKSLVIESPLDTVRHCYCHADVHSLWMRTKKKLEASALMQLAAETS